MFKVHVYCIVLLPFFIMAYALYTSQYRIKSNQKKQITTCKYYLARQESSIDLYSLRRN